WASAAYNTGAACPLERMNRSRSGQWGFLGSCRRNPPKYRAVTISTADSELLGCPEPASVVIRTMSSRIDLARASKASRLFGTVASSAIPESVAAHLHLDRTPRTARRSWALCDVSIRGLSSQIEVT